MHQEAIWLFIPFLPSKISITPIKAPVKKLKNKAAKILGKPKTNPIKNANFILVIIYVGIMTMSLFVFG